MQHLVKLIIGAGLLSLCFSSCGSVQPATVQRTNPDAPRSSSTGELLRAYKAQDTLLQRYISEVVPKFRQFVYVDPDTGVELNYNLFVPNDYDPQTKYPLVLFIADASLTGKSVTEDLRQGYGGLIWATATEQAKHPCLVLVPNYKLPAVDDQYNTSVEVPTTLSLVRHIAETYSVDRDRIYKTGQSRGGMMSMLFGITEPDLFAASLYVGGQWDTSRMAHFKNQKFTYIVAAGDQKAPKGMAQLKDVLRAAGASIAESQWSAKATIQEQNEQARRLYQEGKINNFIIFDIGSAFCPRE